MKKLTTLFTVVLMMVQFAVIAQDDQNGPKIKFDEEKHDFGNVEQGKKVSHTFTFKNTGNEPLVLSNVLSTCGCTVTEWPKDPIPAGKSGKIDVTFNTTGRMGKQNKVVTIISNAVNPQTRIMVTANVTAS